MDKAEELLKKWEQQVPRNGADGEDAKRVMEALGMTVRQGSRGHLVGSHPALIGDPAFPFGVVTVNCHAFGEQGTAHPAAIRDILRAAKVIESNEAEKQDE